jgi:glycosyltransferase involved in cell wall biosynthesis
MNKKKKILFCYQYCNLGGVVSVLKQRAKFLLDDNFELYGYFQRDNGGKKDLLQSGFKEVIIDTEAKFKGLKEMFRTNDFDAVTIIDFPVCIENLPKTNAKIIYEVHTSLERSIEGLNNIDLSKISLFATPSEWSKNWLTKYITKINYDAVKVIPNIVDDTIFYPAPANQNQKKSDEIKILWVGKIVPDKNWIDAVRCFSHISKNYPKANFIFITGGQYTPQQAAEFIEELEINNITKNVTWLQNIDHSKMGEIYREATKHNSILLLTSLHESFSLVIHEALRCGLPVVSSNIDAIPEVIENGVNGYLYNPGDLKSLTQIVTNALFDTKKLDISAYLETEKYNPRNIYSQYKNFIG